MRIIATGLLLVVCASPMMAQSRSIEGTVRDETGAVLPGVSVAAQTETGPALVATTGAAGTYLIAGASAGHYAVTFTLINFATARRELDLGGAAARLDAILHLALNADVVVYGKNTFTNLADVSDPAANLVGIAQSASQGAITARQLDARPVMRSGEVLEAVPGVIISQHSGEGKANQYYLRGFNLDHGTDFASTVSGMPVNMPSHGHGQGYSDLNFLIPELIAGVQFSKGPYFVEQGDFATAGSANINYTNSLAQPLVRVGGGDEGYARALAAGSVPTSGGNVLAGLEIEHNDGPWDQPDDYRKINGIVRFTHGDTLNGFSVTGMAYRGKWNATDQIPQRAVDEGLIGRFGALDPSDGGDTYRYSGSVEWQRSHGNAVTRITGYGVGYDLNLYSNFTFYLDDPVAGDQFHQADHRYILGGRATHRRVGRLFGRETQNTFGAQLRNDDIPKVGLYHTFERQQLDVVRQDAVVETSVGGWVQNETVWSPMVRTQAGFRVDGYRFDVNASDPANGGTVGAGIASPKGGLVVGPWRGSEFYANAGLGFHSNDARGTTITRDPRTGEGVDPVTPLVRARGAEVGARTVAIPHLQSSVALWTLSLDSELVFVGDAGTTEAGRPSHRFGLEWANYYSPRPWLVVDGDLAWSEAHFTDDDPAGDAIPGSVRTVMSAGVTVDSLHNVFGSLRLRYFGPRPLVEDDSVQSKATGLLNLEAGYKLGKRVRLAMDVFNLLDAQDSDVDYFYPSRLRGEPAGGVDDINFHPTLPRTARLNLIVGF